MRYFFIVLFFTIGSLLKASDYYISSSGNDSNSGLSELTPWKSVSKVNSMFSTFQPGDRILFRRGDTFYGTIVIRKSGVSGAPIIIGAYGSGAQPVITGFTTLISWTNEGNGRYSASVTSSVQTNMVIVNGIQVAMGRYPEKGTNLTYSSATAKSITDPGIGDATNWAGAEAIINKNDWTLDRCRISDHAGDILTFLNLGSPQTPYTGRYYFIQNDLRCVTSLNEWYHNISTGKFYIYGDPSSKTVKIATINNLIDNAGYDFITIDGLNLLGSISHAIFCSYGTENWTIKNCAISFTGHSGINFVGGSNVVVDNNKISYCNSTGIYALLNTCSITNNTLSYIGMMPGQSVLYHPIGIYVSGSDFLVQYNDIRYSSWSGIQAAEGTTFSISNNFVDYPCQVLDDGGGIYLSHSAPGARTIEGNIVLHSGIGGVDNERTRGIYLDGTASDALVKDNTVANCFVDGFANHGGNNNTYIGNTSYNNPVSILFQEYTISDNMTGNTLRNNIFFARDAEHISMRFLAPDDDIRGFGTADYNYYLRPVKDDDVFITYDPSVGSSRRTLEEWQYITGQDPNSGKSPITITDVNDIRFEYNASKTNKVITLERPVIDVKGIKYENSITLPPYTSAILMNVPDPAFPVVPVYQSSVIEQISPDKVTMTYNTILANVIPGTSAFKVMVNSSERIVNKVFVSGTTVELVLSVPVSDNDIVTVAYTIPTNNSLQSESTGLAESLSAQPVTNKVDSRRPRMISSTVEANLPNLLKMVFNLDLADIVSPASAFNVMINSLPGAVQTVAVSGTEVRLTLSSPVVSGDIITVAYTAPSTNALRSVQGWYVLSFSAQPVLNKIDGIRPVLVNSSINNSTPNILDMTFNIALSDSYVPSGSSFTVMVNSVARNVNAVSVSGTEVQLTLSSSVVSGDIITVAYTAPSTNALRSTQGWYVLSFGIQPVVNNVINSRPVLINAAVESTAPSSLNMKFSLDLSPGYIPSASAFTVMVNSVARAIQTVIVSGTEVRLTLSSPIVPGDILTVAYTVPSANALRSVPGWYVLSFSAQPVLNKVDGIRPVLVSSSINNSTPNILDMTFNIALSDSYVPLGSSFTVMVNSVARNVNAVSVSGTEVQLTLSSSVVSGDIITVAYTAPSTNALRSTLGWYVLSFGIQPVVNNVINSRPVLINAAVESTAPSILNMEFSIDLSPGFIPSASAFTVFVNSNQITITSVTIYGSKVLLALSTQVLFGDFISVSYTVPSVNALRSFPGFYVLSFNNQSVTNNVRNDRPILLSAVIENKEPAILNMEFSSDLSDNYIPNPSAFTVLVNSVPRSLKSVSITGAVVQLALSSSIVSGDEVTVRYTMPSTNALRSVQGWYVLSFSNQPVINNVVNGRPVLINAVVEFNTTSVIDMTFNMTLSAIYIPPASAFTVMVNSIRTIVSSVLISGSKVSLNLTSTIKYGDVITVAYNVPSSDALRSVPGFYALSFSAQPVTNKCLASSSLKSKSSVEVSDPYTNDIYSQTSEYTQNLNSNITINTHEEIILYPNPASDYINIFMQEVSSELLFLRVFDFSGRICMDLRIEPGINNLSIPLYLDSGTYILKILQGDMSLFTKKLVISK